MVCFADVLYQVLTSKKVEYFFSKSKLNSKYGIIKRAAKKTVVIIYKVMYTEQCEKTLRTEAIELSTMNHLIDFGLYALAGCIIF